jgi:hypothetical protein
MGFQGKTRGLVIGRHMLAERHGRQAGVRFLAQLTRLHRCEQRQDMIIRQAPHIPQRLAPVLPKRLEGIRIRKLA